MSCAGKKLPLATPVRRCMQKKRRSRYASAIHFSDTQEGALSMKKKLLFLMLLLLASQLTACGGGASQGGGPATPTTARIIPTPTLPPGGHVTATISRAGARS